MKTVIRYDSVRIDKAELTSQGFLRIPTLAARIGIQNYRKADGTIIRELRPAQEVFSNDTMESFKNAPVTDNHPFGSVTSENSKQLMIGFTGENVTNVDGKFIGLSTTITDEATIKKIQAGKQEVSAGYQVQLDHTPGEFNGQRYDAIQRNIRINHMAIVARGRAGREVKLKVDSDDAIVIEDGDNPGNPTKENPMKMVKIKVDGKEFEVPEEVANKMKADSAKADESAKEKKDLQEKADSEAKEKAKLQAKIDEGNPPPKKNEDKQLTDEEKKADAAKQTRLAVRARSKVERVAQDVLGSKFDEHSDKDDHELKVTVINHDLGEGNELTKEKSDDESYISARFDMVGERYAKAKASNRKVGQVFNSDSNDDVTHDGDDQDKGFKGQSERSDEQLADQMNNWQKPVGKSKASFQQAN